MLCATSHLERVPHRAVYGRRQHPHEHARPTTDGARRKTSTHRRKRETKDRKHHEARESDRSATASQGTRQAGGGRRKRKREGKSHRDRKHLHQVQRPSTPYARAKKQNNLENHTYMNTWSKARPPTCRQTAARPAGPERLHACPQASSCAARPR